jgi:fucose permease
MFPTGQSRRAFVGVLVTFILSSLFVLARLVSRFGIVKRHGWDDYTIIVAWVRESLFLRQKPRLMCLSIQFLAFGMSFAVAFGTFHGLGLPEENIHPAWVEPLLKARYTALVLYNPALNVTKASILLLYIDLAPRSQRFFYIGSWVTFAVVLVAGVTFAFLAALQCRPVQAVYDPSIKNPTCIPIETIDLAVVPVNVATGLAILVLPIPVLTTLRLPLGKKTILLLIFILGVILIIVADVVGIYYLQLAALNLQQSTARPPVNLKYLYTASRTALWSTVEVNVAIVGACIPTLPPLIKRLIPSLRLIRSQRSSDNQVLRSPSSLPDGAEAGSPRPNGLPRHQSSSTSSGADCEEQPQLQISTRSEEAQSPYQRIHASTFSRSVGFERSRCLLDVRGSESIKYCALVAILLFLEGFIIVLLSSVNGNMPVVENQIQAIGITSATYAAGACIVPFVGYWLLRHVGFKATFVISLALICTGNLIFWPSGASGSYPGFIVATIVVGAGVTLLDMSAIAFLTLCGPTQYAEIRVLMGAGLGYSGSTISFLLSEKIFFTHVTNGRGVIAIQWTYLAVALSMVLLGLFYYYIPLPEATDMDLQSRDNRLWIDLSQRFFGKIPIIFTTLALGVLAEFCSTSSLSSIRTFIGTLLESVSESTQTSPHLTALNLNLAISGIYAGSHFIVACLCLFVQPRIVLLFLFACGVTFSALILWLDFSHATTIEYLVLFFSIPLGPLPTLTFAIALRGMGRWTVFGASVLEGGGDLGPTIYPWIMWAIVQAPSHSVQFAFCAIFTALLVGIIFPLYLNLVRTALPRARSPVWSKGVLSNPHHSHA